MQDKSRERRQVRVRLNEGSRGGHADGTLMTLVGQMNADPDPAAR